MKRVLGLLLAGGTGIALVLMLLLPASASTGGTISLGTVAANTVQVNTGAAPVGWSGYNIGVTTVSSAGVVLASITGANGTALVSGGNPLFCVSASPAAGEKIFGCIGLDGQSVTAAGLLATFTFNATGNGCIQVHLITGTGDPTLDTFTVDASDSSAQTNVIGTTPKNVLIGTGTVNDCPGSATNTPTNTPVPPTNTPTKTSTPTNTPVPPTNTPTKTSTPTNTPVGPTNTPTKTSTPTNTPVGPTNTPTNTPVGPTNTPTNTPVGPTNTPTNTPVATFTSTPTNTEVPPTNTPVPTFTATPTNTEVPATHTAVPTATNTPAAGQFSVDNITLDCDGTGQVFFTGTIPAGGLTLELMDKGADPSGPFSSTVPPTTVTFFPGASPISFALPLTNWTPPHMRVDSNFNTKSDSLNCENTPVATASPQTTASPVQTSTPPVQTSTPPVQTSTPPVQTSTPPVQTSTPPVQTSTPPVQTSTPPVSVTPNTETPTDTPEVPTDTPTNTPEVPTDTPTNTPVGPTNTPTNTPVGPTNTPTNTPVPTSTVVLTFNTATSTTVVNTSTPLATSTTRPASTSTAVSNVLGNQTGPRGGAAGTVALPATGQGPGNDSGRYLFAVLALAVGGLGLVSALTFRKRQR